MSSNLPPGVTNSMIEANAGDSMREQLIDTLWDGDISNEQIEAFIQHPNAKPTLSPGERDAIAREFAFDMGISAVVVEERIRKAIDAALLKAGVGE